MLNSFQQFRQKIRDINQRYSKPHIEMSPAVKWSLIALRIYLLLLVSLMVYKFVLLVN